MASIVRLDRDAPLDWGQVAIVRMPLQSVIDTHRADAEWLHRPLEGGWLREVDLQLDSGRVAYLEERRAYPDQFTIHLVCHRDLFYFKEDYDEVIQFLAVQDESVTLLTGQVRWWKKKLPAPVPMVQPAARVARHQASRVVDLKALKSAVQSHAGTFICEAINAPKQRKVVAFRHIVTAPRPLGASVPDIGGIVGFYSTFDSIDFYHDEKTGVSAQSVASPSAWPELQRLFRMWLEPVEGPGRDEALPDWIDDCLVIGEEPRTGNYILMPRSGRCAGHVFTFDHDGFDFVDEADSLPDYVQRLLELDDKLLSDIAEHMRFVGDESNQQWWIREASDNRGKVARTKR